MDPATAEEMTVGQDRMTSGAPLRLRAPAKINLTLAVLGKRPDGFHEIESVVMPVALYDDLAFSHSGEAQIQLSCDDTSIPTGPDNLIYRAAERLAERSGLRRGVCIRLTKRIPVGAGLGGGSSDAAATLVGLNGLWQLGLARSALVGLAAELGSDVPLFLGGGPVIVRGRGERLEPVALDWAGWVVLVVPAFAMSTREVYQHWRSADSPPRSAAEVVQASLAGEALDGLLYNMLEGPAFAVEPRLAELHTRMVELGATGARMSGSGSGLFALFGDAGRAESFAAQVAREPGVRVHVVPTAECEHL